MVCSTGTAKLDKPKAAAKKPKASVYTATDIATITAAVLAALDARSPAGAHAKARTDKLDKPKAAIATITAAVLTALDARSAALSGADHASDSRATALSALSKLTFSRVGLDSLANRHLFNDLSLFEKSSIRTLKHPLSIEVSVVGSTPQLLEMHSLAPYLYTTAIFARLFR